MQNERIQDGHHPYSFPLVGADVMKGVYPGRQADIMERRITPLWVDIMIGEYPLCGEDKSGAKHEVEGFLMRRVCEDDVIRRGMLKPRITS